VDATFPGDDLLPEANVVMDRQHQLHGRVDEVWPWIQQLGKDRGGWYLPERVERRLPSRFRGLRTIDPDLRLAVGDVVPDYGPAHLAVAVLEPPHALVYRATWGRRRYTWALLLTSLGNDSCLLHSRFRLDKGGVVARSLGDLLDRASIGLMARGLSERLRNQAP